MLPSADVHNRDMSPGVMMYIVVPLMYTRMRHRDASQHNFADVHRPRHRTSCIAPRTWCTTIDGVSLSGFLGYTMMSFPSLVRKEMEPTCSPKQVNARRRHAIRNSRLQSFQCSSSCSVFVCSVFLVNSLLHFPAGAFCQTHCDTRCQQSIHHPCCTVSITPVKKTDCYRKIMRTAFNTTF